VRLLALLDETKAELAKVKVREVTAQKDKTATISKMLAAQAELDIALADITILSKSNEELRSKLSECKVT
jgi:ribosomal protein L29